MFKRLSIIFFILTLFTGTAISAHLPEEHWYVIEEYDQPIGSINEQFFPTDSGFSYTAELKMHLSLLGELLTITEQIELLLDKDFAILTANQISGINDLVTYHELAIDYTETGTTGVLQFRDHQGYAEEKRFELDPGTKVYYPDTTLFQIIATDELIPGKEYQALFLETLDFLPIPGELIIGEPQDIEFNDQEITAFHVQYTQAGVTAKLLVHPDLGILINSSQLNPELRIRRVEQENLPELEINEMLLGLYTAPINLQITHPFRTTRSVIRLTGLDLDQTQLCDNRQAALSIDLGEDTHEVLIEIRQDRTNYLNRYSLPFKAPHLDDYLTSDRHIMPDLPEIQVIVADILGNETDAWLGVKALNDWVFRFINDEPSYRNLTTAQILESQAGDCNEHAILFASLARAAGIPTKIAQGFRATNHGWVAHMWNEVWLDEWISIDPSHGQTAPDALLLKLFDSSSAEDLNIHEVNIMTNLNIRIQMYETPIMGANNPNRPNKTQISEQTYTNSDFIFSVTIPDNWFYVDISETGVLALDQTQLANVNLELFSLPKEIDPLYLIELQSEMLTTAMAAEGIQVYGPENSKPVTIGNYQGNMVSWGLDLEGLIFYQELVVLKIEDMFYTFVFTVPAMYYDFYQLDYEVILDNFTVYI